MVVVMLWKGGPSSPHRRCNEKELLLEKARSEIGQEGREIHERNDRKKDPLV